MRNGIIRLRRDIKTWFTSSRSQVTAKDQNFIPANVWPAWIEYLNTDEVKYKSHVAKKNKLSEPDGPGTGISKHRGGLKKNESLLIRLPNGIFFYGSTTLKEMKCLLMINLSMLQKVRSRIEAISQSQTPGDSVEGSGVNMMSLFLDVVGVLEKKRVFGLGNRSQIYSISTGDLQSTSQVNTNMISNFEDRLQSLETELRDYQARLQRE
ncbi:hypothetical protein C2S53_019714 [Perilla frutescens var. hirtella]|uniref:Uncharacterized protein n=1 Tax=Perilla frutescens var. hirtella TaxID=608512 RepID=A0AAD4J0V3_PERFH|nr:hypothetical protein C2S53_019714 [Perilla frutescens var. hirtella]